MNFNGFNRLIESNKFKAAVAVILLIFFRKLFPALDIDIETAALIVAVGSSWILGQGLADSGKEAEKIKESTELIKLQAAKIIRGKEDDNA